jgi:hypothetical protein
MKVLGTALAVLSAAIAIEAFYVHPTYGRGLRAMIAVVQAGGAL